MSGVDESSSEPSGHAATAASELPLFPLNLVLFPGGQLPLRIFEPRYVDMVRACMREGAPFGVVLIEAGAEVGPVTRTANVGTSARIVDFFQLPDGLLGIACVGERKFRIVERRVQSDGLNVGDVEWLGEEPSVPLPREYAHLAQLLERVLPRAGDVYKSQPLRLDDASWVGNRLTELLPMAPSQKQALLEMEDPVERLARLSPLIRRSEI
jgi:Lon protease-like protein